MHHSINASVNSQWHNSRFFLLFLFFNFKYSFRFYSTLQAKCTMWIFKNFFYYVFYTSSASIIDICVCHTTGLFSWEKKRPTAFEQPIHFSSWILSSYHSSTFFFYLHLNRLQKCFIFIGQFVIVLKRKWRILVILDSRIEMASLSSTLEIMSNAEKKPSFPVAYFNLRWRGIYL